MLTFFGFIFAMPLFLILYIVSLFVQPEEKTTKGKKTSTTKKTTTRCSGDDCDDCMQCWNLHEDK